MSSTSPPPPPPSGPPPPPGSPLPPPPSSPTGGSDKPWWKRWWGITTIVVAALVVLGALTGPPEDDGDLASATDTTTESAEPEPKATESGTEDAAPTEEPTPEPASVELPDVTGMDRSDAQTALEGLGLQVQVRDTDVDDPADTGTVISQQPAAGTDGLVEGDTVTLIIGGDFVWSEPFTVSGTGNDVIVDFAVPTDALAIARVSHEGGGNFALWTYNGSGERIDLLVNTIGSYRGTRLVNLEDPVRELEVEAGGSWSIEFAPISQARQIGASGSMEGTGDDVVVAGAEAPDARTVTLTHDGSANFGIWAYSDVTTDLLVNDIGPYEGTSRWPAGEVVVLDITADGTWTISLE